MAQDDVKLFGFWASPFSLRVKWALSLKEIQYEYIEEDPFNKTSKLLQYNPMYKKVPILLDNDNPLVESLVIIEYIDDTWKNYPLLPKEPLERAKARLSAKFVDDKCVPAIVKTLLSTRDQKDKFVKEARLNLKVLENSLNDTKRPFIGGEKLSFIDIAIAWLGIWIQAVEKITHVKLLDDEYTPLLNQWFRNVLDVQVIKESVPSFDKLVADKKDFRNRIIMAKL